MLTDTQGAANASSIQWGPCDPSLITNPSLLCGFFEIPLDYNDSSVGKGRIAVIKANATGDRRGTFFMNPGQPHFPPSPLVSRILSQAAPVSPDSNLSTRPASCCVRKSAAATTS